MLFEQGRRWNVPGDPGGHPRDGGTATMGACSAQRLPEMKTRFDLRGMRPCLRHWCSLWLALVPLSASAAGPVTDTRSSPRARVQPVDLGAARWTGGFWFDRFENLRTNMVPAMGRLMEGTNVSQYLENFRIAAGDVKGRPRGAPFNDGDFYKWIEAASAVLACGPDPALEASVSRAVDVIGRAQRADGYLHTPVLIRSAAGDTNAVPFRDRNNFEMYNLGHLMTAACIHHRVTGDDRLLKAATRAAGYLEQVLASAPPETARSSVCPSHYMGLVELARLTGDPRPAALARRLLDIRSGIRDGGDDNQDRVPFLEQRVATGHAVRANYLYAGATDLFLETGDPALWTALERLWTNVVERKLYLTGGCGALYDGASPDGSRDQNSITRTHQAYGRDYQLPNTTAHNETCAAIGNVLWNWRLFLATGDARYMDVIEGTLLNAVLAGVGLDGVGFFYTNPLRVTDPMPVELRWSRRRVTYVSSFCCPPNVLRTLAETPAYAYATSTNALWVNLYGASVVTTRVGSSRVRVEQETGYPWDGRVRLTLRECGADPMTVRLRIPSWATGATLRLNGSALPAATTPGQYTATERVWTPGDVLELDLPMPVRVLEANPLVEETRNQVAIQRGPTVYCLESADLPDGVGLLSVGVPGDIGLRPRREPQLLGGCVVLEGVARTRPAAAWKGGLYREVDPTPSRPVPLRFIPYSLWANRGAGEMSVWLPRLDP